MKFLFYLLLSIFSYFNIVQSQEFNLKKIKWECDFKLKWNNYRYIQPDSLCSSGLLFFNGQKANSMLIIDYSEKNIGGFPYFEIYNYFIPDSSWTIDTLDKGLLKHEQLHFDIDQLYVRKIKRSIEELRKGKVTDINIYYEKINVIMNEMDSLQAKYDEDTFHGAIKEAQKEWEKKIELELFDHPLLIDSCAVNNTPIYRKIN